MKKAATYRLSEKDVKNHFSVPVIALKTAPTHFRVTARGGYGARRQAQEQAAFFSKCYPGNTLTLVDSN